MRHAILRFLANNRTAAEVVAQTAGLFTRALRRTNVAMFHPGRCGSTVVGMLLNQHPQIKWAGEVFGQFKNKYGEEAWVRNYPHKMIKLRTNLSISSVFGIEVKFKNFKDMNMREEGIIDFLKHIGYEKFIVLERRNYLKERISAIVGKKIGRWNTKKDIKPPKVEVPLKDKAGESLIDKFKDRDKFYKSIRKNLDVKFLDISYESDIRKNPKIAFKKIVKYLGLSKVGVVVETKKINKGPVHDRISNYEEVSEYLSGTEYSWMLRD